MLAKVVEKKDNAAKGRHDYAPFISSPLMPSALMRE